MSALQSVTSEGPFGQRHPAPDGFPAGVAGYLDDGTAPTWQARVVKDMLGAVVAHYPRLTSEQAISERWLGVLARTGWSAADVVALMRPWALSGEDGAHVWPGKEYRVIDAASVIARPDVDPGFVTSWIARITLTRDPVSGEVAARGLSRHTADRSQRSMMQSWYAVTSDMNLIEVALRANVTASEVLAAVNEDQFDRDAYLRHLRTLSFLLQDRP